MSEMVHAQLTVRVGGRQPYRVLRLQLGRQVLVNGLVRALWTALQPLRLRPPAPRFWVQTRSRQRRAELEHLSKASCAGILRALGPTGPGALLQVTYFHRRPPDSGPARMLLGYAGRTVALVE
ncbi:hypothetical protein SS50377_22985 [Spironucleus salmonicida]|uniref:Uncharacterized protein n=1 Tax=Spironucleus salmonicida TaxID=348837 RepID=A0A9P8LVG9_9EUKA|nr:hypothetical protein SS50377_22985 [Spironucleus salmonicida]